MNLEEQALFHRQSFVKLHKRSTWSLGAQIAQNALERPDHPAIIYNDQVLTYKQFNQISDKYACYFGNRVFARVM